MSHTALPSIKGQITIPPEIREKYHISKQTPIIIEDKGKGVLMLKIMSLVAADEIEYYENKKEFGITFKHGIDPQVLIDAIEEIDG